MTKKSVFIFARTSQLAHVGGPFGYLNNLRHQTKKEGITNIHFIEDGKYKKTNKRLKELRKVLYPFKKAYYYRSILKRGRSSRLIEECKDDFIYFHFTEDLFKYRDSLNKYHGKIILTSHSPTLASLQIIDSLSNFEKKVFNRIYSKLIKMDKFAFEHADYIVFPCEEAEEPYSHAWKEFDEFKQKNKSKFKYIPTGIDQCVATVTSDKVFSKYEIPNNSFVVSFVGRHNEIKGYDNLKVIGKNIISTIANSYFLIAGNENPLHGLDNKRWIEAGWTNDPYSLINASDVFILPNKETYFDLVFLEVLSLGKTIVASKTGGNKYFERFKSSGIYLYSSIQECEEILQKLSHRTSEEIRRDEEANLKIYQKYFTSKVFLKNYLNLINSLKD